MTKDNQSIQSADHKSGEATMAIGVKTVKSVSSRKPLIFVAAMFALGGVGATWIYRQNEVNSLKKINSSLKEENSLLSAQVKEQRTAEATAKKAVDDIAAEKAKTPSALPKVKISKSEMYKDEFENGTFFVTYEVTNKGTAPYYLNLSDIKVKNVSNNTLPPLEACFGNSNYPQAAALISQTVQPGETVSGYQCFPTIKGLTFPAKFVVMFTDSTTGVATSQDINVSKFVGF